MNKKNLIRVTSTLLIIALCVIALAAVIVGIDWTKSPINNVDISAVSYSTKSDIDMNSVNDEEVYRANTIIEAMPDNDMLATFGVARINADEIVRSFTLKDIDGEEKYLYIEYGAGYAVYDRIGEFVYERAQIGEGPYSEYTEIDTLYYGGPAYYLVKKGNEFYNISSGYNISYNTFAAISVEMESIRKEYLNGEETELSFANIAEARATETFVLAEKIKDNGKPADYAINAQLYFMAMLFNFTKYPVAGDCMAIIEDMDATYDTGITDVIFGNNLFGSCGYVTLASTMLYYDRVIGVDMLPNDISDFDMMYDYNVSFTSDTYKDYLDYSNGRYTGNLYSIDKNMMASEVLHQKLLYDSPKFTYLRGKTYSQLLSMANSQELFGCTLEDLIESFNIYKNEIKWDGYTKHKYTVTNGTYLLPEKIVAGDPCTVAFKGDISIEGNVQNIKGHGAVGVAFQGTHGLWYTVDSVTCMMGWHNYPASALVDVNANIIMQYGSINVLR